MTLQDRLIADLKVAMREHDVPRREAIRMLRAAVLNEEIERRRQLDDAQLRRVVERLIRRHEDSIEQFKKGGRQDLVEYEEAQLTTVRSYLAHLPRTELAPEEVEARVRAAIAETGATGPADSGRVMQKLAAELRGQTDLKQVNQMVQELLRA